MRKLCLVGLALALCGFLGGCKPQRTARGSMSSGHETRGYQMGDPVKTGPLVYTVLDTEWFDQIGDSAAPRLPHNHFLSVRISVTNTGSLTSGIPPLTIMDSQHVTYAEISDVKDLPEWLGYIRTVKPAETLHGSILFDVPTGSYGLKVVDDAEPENQSSALIQMPLELVRP
jgi:Domain of unknown function (DUF4352)